MSRQESSVPQQPVFSIIGGVLCLFLLRVSAYAIFYFIISLAAILMGFFSFDGSLI